MQSLPHAVFTKGSACQVQYLPHTVLAKCRAYQMGSLPQVMPAKYGTTYHMQFLPNAEPTTCTAVLTIRSACQIRYLQHRVLDKCGAYHMPSLPQVVLAKCGTIYYMQFLPTAAPTTCRLYHMQFLPNVVLPTTCSSCQM